MALVIIINSAIPTVWGDMGSLGTGLLPALILETKSCRNRSASTSTQTFALGVTLLLPHTCDRRGAHFAPRAARLATVSHRVNRSRVSTSHASPAI